MCHESPLFERLGGFSVLADAASIFYSRISKDSALLNLFGDVDVGRQTQKVLSFMAWAFHGPADLCGPELRSVHERLTRSQGLTDAHFDAIAHHLINTLKELRIEKALIDEVVAVVIAIRNDGQPQ